MIKAVEGKESSVESASMREPSRSTDQLPGDGKTRALGFTDGWVLTYSQKSALMTLMQLLHGFAQSCQHLITMTLLSELGNVLHTLTKM